MLPATSAPSPAPEPGRPAPGTQLALAGRNLPSEAVSEVFSQPPPSLVRWGITVVAGILASLLVGAWFIRYPAVIPGRAVITTRTPPLKLLAKANGQLSALLVRDHGQVRKGALLAEIENATRLGNVEALRRLTADARRFLQTPDAALPLLPEGVALGSLQEDYNELVKNYHDYRRLLTDAYHAEQVALLKGQIDDYGELIRSNARQLEINELEFRNAEQKYQANVLLYRQQVSARHEFMDQENGYLLKKKERENYRKTLIENRLVLADKRNRLAELLHQRTAQERSVRDNLARYVRNLENALSVWGQTYLVTAPADGQIVFLKYLQPNQPVRAADTLFALLPRNEGQPQPYVGFVTIAAPGMGKVRAGQRVIIKLDDFPHQEFGSLAGTVTYIAPTPTPGHYRLSVALPGGLVSRYGKELRFKPEMAGTAEIITQDQRLLERVFQGIRALAGQ